MNLSDRGGQIEGKVMRIRLSVFWWSGQLVHGLGNSLVPEELICNE